MVIAASFALVVAACSSSSTESSATSAAEEITTTAAPAEETTAAPTTEAMEEETTAPPTTEAMEEEEAAPVACDTEVAAGVHTLTVDGIDVMLYIPAGAEGVFAPMMVNLHPSSGTAAQTFADSIHMADSNGVALLVPEGVAAPMLGGWQWNVPGVPLFQGLPLENNRDDVAFIEQVIDAAFEEACIDPARVYIAGFSGGARMASQVACGLGDRIAAVVPISGVRFPLASDADLGLPDSEDCDPARPVPVLAIHGVQDPVNVWADEPPAPEPGQSWSVVPAKDKEGGAWSYSGQTAINRWVEFNGCDATPTTTSLNDSMELVEYGGCTDGADVKVVLVKGGGHAVPGYPNKYGPGQANMDVNGWDLAWDLMASYHLSEELAAASSGN